MKTQVFFPLLEGSGKINFTKRLFRENINMSMLKISKWLVKFTGHILLYHMIIRFVFRYKIQFYKVKYKEDIDESEDEDEDRESRMKTLKALGLTP